MDAQGVPGGDLSREGDTPHPPAADVEAGGSLAGEKYRQLFAALDEGFCIIEVLFDAHDEAVDYFFIEHNAAFVRLSGLSDVVGRRIRELAPRHEQAWFDTFGRVALTGVPERFELRADAMRHWYDVYAFRVDTPRLRRVAVIFNDISERKLTEAALRESEGRYRALAEDRETMLEAERQARMEVDRAIQARDETMATLSHELRTPLSSIVTWARLLQKQFLHDEEMLQKGLTVIGDNAMALGRLISDLLDNSRIYSGKFELSEEVFDLHALIESVCATVRPVLGFKQIELEVKLEGAAEKILADAARLRQVLLNLLSNSIKFTPEKGWIQVCCRRADGQFFIEVRDNGEGIDRLFLPQLFRRFSQADTVRDRRRGGLGLGLSIAREIIEQHGGTIHAHSAGPGEGSCFTVVLPGDLADRAARMPGAVPEPCFAHQWLAGMRVLAVEDQPDMHELLRRVLADHGAQVTVVDTADEALTLLGDAPQSSGFDVLVSDIGLPVLDGNALIRKVRQNLHLDATRLPAVAVSGYARQEDRQRALEAGYQAYVTKPYDVATLISMLRDLRAQG